MLIFNAHSFPYGQRAVEIICPAVAEVGACQFTLKKCLAANRHTGQAAYFTARNRRSRTSDPVRNQSPGGKGGGPRCANVLPFRCPVSNARTSHPSVQVRTLFVICALGQ